LLDELKQKHAKHAKHAKHVFSYVDSEGCSLNLDELISSQPKGTHVYVCGLKPIIDAVINCCNKHCYLDEYIHWEQFASTVPEDGREGFYRCI